jgi:TolA-binding protein
MRVGSLTLKISFCFAVLALIATGTPAIAAQKKKPKTTPVVKPGTELESLKFVEGDEKSNEMKALKTELMISRSEVKAIETARQLIKKHAGKPMEAELHFRLGELYMRRAKTARFFEINRQSKSMVRVAPQVVANANSRRQIELAVAEYELIQTRFPRFKQLDLVIFNNAFARQQLGQEREAERLYWSLVQNFKSSPLVPDCHLAIGEISFDRSNFSFALEHFNAIKKYPESRVYPYGLYKAAWAHYNMRNPEGGLKKLEEVVAYGKYVRENKIDSRLDLRKEALSDMTLFYEDVKPAKEAFSYFRKQASELDVGPVILRLAKLYEHHSRHEDRQVVLSEFIKNIPESEHIAEIQGELIWNYDAMKKKDLAVKQMESLSDLCRESSSWLKAQRRVAKDAKAADPRIACMATLSDASLKLAGRWLKLWKRGANQADYGDAAEKAYEIFLREPGDTKETNQARFAYAELLFQRQKFRRASEEYAKVGSSKDAGSLRHDATYGAVLSFEKAVGDKWSDSDEKTFRELTKNYLTANPKGQYRIDVEFKLALIAYEKSRYDEAGPMFIRLGREFAKTEKGKKAQDLYLDILNLKKDYKGLKDYSGDLMRVESDAARKTKLAKIHEQSYFLQIQSYEDSQKFSDAIAGYKDFATQNPGSELAEKAWWNSVQLHFKTMDFAGGALAAEQFFDRFPNAKNGMDALLKAAQSYETMGMLEEAADVLVKIAKVEPKSAAKWHGLAADFYLLSNRPLKAKKYLAELKGSGDPTVRAQTLDKLLMIEKQTGGAAYQEILQAIAASGVQPQASLARVELVEEIYKKGKFEEAFSEAKKIVGTGSASPYAKSRARMIHAKILEDEFLRASVKARAEKVATVLGIKTEKLEKAQQAFQQAIKYGDPNVSVDALRRLAGCYTHYIQALKTMPTPAGFTPEDETAFRGELSNLVIPLEEKAIETLQEGIRAAARLRLEGPIVTGMRDSLKKLNMPLPSTNDLDVTEPGLALPTVAGVGL